MEASTVRSMTCLLHLTITSFIQAWIASFWHKSHAYLEIPSSLLILVYVHVTLYACNTSVAAAKSPEQLLFMIGTGWQGRTDGA